jgi:hypothetical protein
MKTLFLISALLCSQVSFSQEAPANISTPQVKKCTSATITSVMGAKKQVINFGCESDLSSYKTIEYHISNQDKTDSVSVKIDSRDALDMRVNVESSIVSIADGELSSESNSAIRKNVWSVMKAALTAPSEGERSKLLKQATENLLSILSQI